MDAGTVDDDPDRPIDQGSGERFCRCCLVGHIEGDRLRRSAGSSDVGDNGFGAIAAAISMDVDVASRNGQAAADRGADCAAAAGDDSPSHGDVSAEDGISACRTTAARPLITGAVPQDRTKR